MKQDISRKIFLTDDEFEELFGREITSIVKILNETARQVCPVCKGHCCKNIGCLFFSEAFGTCPIFHIRPRECRYHFCNDIFVKAPLGKEEKEAMVKPVEELICGDKGKVAGLFFLFPEFPLDEKGLESMGIKDGVERIKKAFEKGELDKNNAFILLQELCNRFDS